jgi:hypothetical protein
MCLPISLIGRKQSSNHPEVTPEDSYESIAATFGERSPFCGGAPAAGGGGEADQRGLTGRDTGIPLFWRRMCLSTYMAASAALSRLSLVDPSSG